SFRPLGPLDPLGARGFHAFGPFAALKIRPFGPGLILALHLGSWSMCAVLLEAVATLTAVLPVPIGPVGSLGPLKARTPFDIPPLLQRLRLRRRIVLLAVGVALTVAMAEGFLIAVILTRTSLVAILLP